MHLLILSHGTPAQHERFRQKVDTLKYPYEGPLRKGYNIPHLSEFKLWDVRIKKEVAPQFLKDMGVLDETLLTHPNHKKHLNVRVYSFLVKVLRKIFRLKKIDYADLEQHEFMESWYQNFFIGAIEDPETQYGEEL